MKFLIIEKEEDLYFDRICVRNLSNGGCFIKNIYVSNFWVLEYEGIIPVISTIDQAILKVMRINVQKEIDMDIIKRFHYYAGNS
jgi:hypothetical protein